MPLLRRSLHRQLAGVDDGHLHAGRRRNIRVSKHTQEEDAHAAQAKPCDAAALLSVCARVPWRTSCRTGSRPPPPSAQHPCLCRHGRGRLSAATQHMAPVADGASRTRTLDDTAEHDVAAVQPGRLHGGDEELAAVGVLHSTRAREEDTRGEPFCKSAHTDASARQHLSAMRRVNGGRAPARSWPWTACPPWCASA
jgi:hypothetical protein